MRKQITVSTTVGEYCSWVSPSECGLWSVGIKNDGNGYALVYEGAAESVDYYLTIVAEWEASRKQ